MANADDPRKRDRFGTARIFAIVFGVIAAIASAEFYALWQARRIEPLAPPAEVAEKADGAGRVGAVDAPAGSPGTPSVAPGIVGSVEIPTQESVVGSALSASGWALARDGIRNVEVRIDGLPYATARYGIPRPDVAKIHPGYPDSAASGFAFEGRFADLQLARHVIEFVATDKRGAITPLATRSLIPSGAMAMWRSLLDARPTSMRQSFYFLMMTSGLHLGGAQEVDTQYRDYLSRAQRIGISVPILYMRTTRGTAHDWQFDPDFDLSRKCADRLVADDNLASVIHIAIEKRLPVQFILNGGIWGDASCETPQWDLTDHLEQDPANCQWSQHDRVFPDNYLSALPGSTASPQLARSLTYNVYASKVRTYKRRNLQAAARIIASFAREHAELFVGVALDADTYMNPFFRGQEVFDYNPGMLRQFRDWLRGIGPYAGHPIDGAPDLSAYRRAKPMTLAAVNALARKHWRTWNEVEPPRRLPGIDGSLPTPGERPIWDDPWWNLWDAFRKHIIDLHYDELSTWVHQAGISRDRIFSAQGLIHTDTEHKPFAIHVDSPSRDYDSAGVSVEGAIPRDGHLGAVIYGRTARNDIEMEDGHSLFATFGRMDDGWAIVEYNNTDLRFPNVPPDYAMAYRTFRDAFNYGAREISAMAWNGSNGLFVGQIGHTPYTSWRNTPAEDAMRDFLVSHADVPSGARLWTFGTPRRPDSDGWTAERGRLTAGSGFLTLEPDGETLTLLSPPDQVIRPARIDRLVLRFDGNARPSRVRVAAQIVPGSAWRDVGEATRTELALRWPTAWRDGRTIVERLRLELSFPSGTGQSTMSRVLLYPRASRR
jgi:hypothetical protein